MKKYNLAKREGAYQKAPSGPRRGHIERARIDRGDIEQGYLGESAEDILGLVYLCFFSPLRNSVSLRCSSLC